MQMQNFEKHVWAEIDLEALRHNFRVVKARAGALPLCAVVKADSYGHGAVQCAKTALNSGAEYLGVATVDEAIALREAYVNAPILILGEPRLRPSRCFWPTRSCRRSTPPSSPSATPRPPTPSGCPRPSI